MTEQIKTGTDRPVWEAETTHPELCDLLRKGLSEITDPEINLNIIQLGLVRNVKIDEDGGSDYV